MGNGESGLEIGDSQKQQCRESGLSVIIKRDPGIERLCFY